MLSKRNAIIVGAAVSVAAVALGLGLGLGLGFPSSKVSKVSVRGTVASREALPLQQQYVHQNDAYLVQTATTAADAIKLWVATKDAPTSLTEYALVPRDAWPIPLPQPGQVRGTCMGGKEAKNACTELQAGEFSTRSACKEKQCEWGYKCRLGLGCSPAPTGTFLTGIDCSSSTACGWRYKCVNNACILAADGTHDTFAACRATCI